MSTPPDWSALLNDVTQRAVRYYTQEPDVPVYPAPEAIAGLGPLDTELPEHPEPAGEIVARLDGAGSPATVRSTGGRYFGFVTGGALPATVAANWLTTAWDQNSALTVMSPVAAQLESTALGWLRTLLGLPGEVEGAFVTGATMANLTGLAAARHAVLERHGWDVEQDGLVGAPPITVIAGEEAHVTLFKALGLLGLGRKRAVRVPTDSQGRMKSGSLPPFDGPAIVCLQAGNVNTGAFDPAADLCAEAKERGAWVHVDGAFGLWAAVSPEFRHLTQGLDLADSWATDAHKWLNVPYDSGLAFVRDRKALRASMAATAAYLDDSGPREPMHYTPDSSRRARAVEIWAALRSLGRSGLAGLIERCCRHARRFAEGLSGAGMEVLNEVVLNQVLVSFGEATPDVIRRVQQDGVCWCGGTVWQGRPAMRISVSSWRTTTEDVDRSLESIVRAARRR